MKMKAFINLVFNAALIAAYESNEEHESHLIVREMSNSLDLREDVPTDCWVRIVDDLSQPSKSLIHPQFSNSANFCSSLGTRQKQAFAFGLSKCHMNESGKSFLIPDNCEGNDISQGTNQSSVVGCLAALPESAFLIYSQFFTHVEVMCVKLTEELRIHRKNDALEHFEKSAREIGAKFEMIQHSFEESGIIFDRFEEYAKMMDTKIKNIAEIEGFAKTIDDKIQSVDRKLEDMVSKTIFNSIDRTTKSFLAEVYEKSGLESYSTLFTKLKHRGIFNFSTAKLIFRLLIISLALLATITSRRFIRCRKLIFCGSFFELVFEHLIHYLQNIGLIEPSEYNYCARLLRKYSLALYFVAMFAAYISSFVMDSPTKVDNTTTPQVSSSTISQMNTVLEEMQERFRKESENHRKDREEMVRERLHFQQQMMTLHQQLHETLSSRQHVQQPVQQQQYYSPSIPRYTQPVSKRVTENQSFFQPCESTLSGRLTPRYIPGVRDGNSSIYVVNTNDAMYPAIPTSSETPVSAFSPVIASSTIGRHSPKENLCDNESPGLPFGAETSSDSGKRKLQDEGLDTHSDANANTISKKRRSS